MRVKLAYGKSGLWIELPDEAHVAVIEPRFTPGLADEAVALTAALRNPLAAQPLAQAARATDRVGIIFSDITRATPHRLILPAVLAELAHVPREQITFFVALGTHRPNTAAELRSMLGDQILDGYRIVQNNAFDRSTQIHVGHSSRGNDIWLNAELLACDVKVLTGFIEPHFFAGFSGGGKAIMPGMAGLTTIFGNHSAKMLGDPRATWGITQGNPIWEDVHEVAGYVGGLFLVNVTLNREKQITGVFAGDLVAAHRAGCEVARSIAMAPVAAPFDLVITTNSGYPLDLNLYQTVKGMSAAAQVVRPGGTIIVASECWDGIPEHGLYGRLLADAGSPERVLEMVNAPGFERLDQWQVQIQAQIQQRADVYVYADGLTNEQIAKALLRPCRSIEATVSALLERYGPQATVCVLPEGPQTIPYVTPAAVVRD